MVADSRYNANVKSALYLTYLIARFIGNLLAVFLFGYQTYNKYNKWVFVVE